VWILAHNARVPNWLRYVLALSLCLGWVGCTTPDRPARLLTPLAVAPVPAPPEEPLPPPPRVEMRDTNQVAWVPAVTNRVPKSPQPVTNLWLNTWVPLSFWCQDQGLAKPRVERSNGQVKCELTTTNGVLGLTMGSRIAHWNQATFWLGQRPRLVDGTPYIHALDGLKTLRPLVAEKCLFKSPSIVILDPGHGGMDSGTVSILGQGCEKNYTLDWALRVQRILATNGVKVILTRTNDLDLALSNRLAIAEACAADLFISLHFNSASPALEPSGLETYCLTPAGLLSSLTRETGEDLMLTCPNNAFDFQNWQLALRFQQTLLAATGATDRSVRRARFLGVLRGQNRPAVLIEGGFLSNPAEARKIASPAYRQQLSQALARAIQDVLRTRPAPTLTRNE
jgi:N-acetylmuramoyl-L-alanine amidase